MSRYALFSTALWVIMERFCCAYWVASSFWFWNCIILRCSYNFCRTDDSPV